MIIEETRDERTDHKIMRLKGLMDRRRLMDATGDRLEVLNVKDPWVEIAIPSDHVEGVVVEDMFGQPVANLDPHFEFAALGMSLKVFGHAKITLGVWRMLEQLPEFV